ncbi:MAG: NTP transferase domain-containing protein, partial [bacterium]
PLQASIGCATINAFLSKNGLPVEVDDTVDLFDILPDDRVGLVGNMCPIVPRIEEKAREVIIFEDNPFFGTHETFPWWAEKLELQACDVAITTGVAFTNKSIDEILEYSKKARFRAVVGPSTPMSNVLLGPARFDFIGGVRIVNLEMARDIVLKGGGTRNLQTSIMKTYISRKRKNISAIVLAAGAGERFGFIPKALLTLGDKTFLEIIIDKLRRVGINDIVVVLGAKSDDIKSIVKSDEVRFVVNYAWQTGMLSSIISGINSVTPDADAVMIHPVDFPLVKIETYKILKDKWLSAKRGIVSPSFENKLGHPVIVSRGYFDEIRKVPSDKGARAVIHGYEGKKDLIVVEVDDPYVRMDIDTEDDYKKLTDEE